MEVIVPNNNLDFGFNSAMSSPRYSPPSTPKQRLSGHNYYFSAPSTPSRLSQFYHDFYASSDSLPPPSSSSTTVDFYASSDSLPPPSSSSTTVPFEWEEKPGTPKSQSNKNLDHQDIVDDFAFDVSQDWGKATLSAEELFDGGVIKPLKPPPRLQQGSSPPNNKRRPSISKKLVHSAISLSRYNKPRHQHQQHDSNEFITEEEDIDTMKPMERGRQKGVNLPKSSKQRVGRSLSPLREIKPTLKDDEEESKEQMKGHKKWSFKDFFLFRSASEGRATDKDSLNKYTAAVRHSSFRGIDGSESGSGSGSRRRGQLSAHEMHYKANRAVSEDLKKKTFLPYKHGILGGWRSILPSSTR